MNTEDRLFIIEAKIKAIEHLLEQLSAQVIAQSRHPLLRLVDAIKDFSNELI